MLVFFNKHRDSRVNRIFQGLRMRRSEHVCVGRGGDVCVFSEIMRCHNIYWCHTLQESIMATNSTLE